MLDDYVTIEVNGHQADQAVMSVRVQDLTGYHGMILCNALGWAPVSRVDDLAITQDEAFAGVISAAIDNCPWDQI